jgi:hypothetical protein
MSRRFANLPLDEANRQLSAQGLFAKAGETSTVDATVIEAKQSR